MRKAFFTVWVFAKLNTRRFFRDRLALFFGILFPLIFLFVFGGIFGKSSDTSFRVAVINQSDTTFAKDFTKQINENKIFKVDKEATNLDQAKEKMTRSQVDATIVLPDNFGEEASGHPSGQAKVLYSQNSSQAGQTLVAIMDNIFKGVNSKFVNTRMPFTVVGEAQTNKSLSAFDYTFAGLLGFSIIGLGIFGPMNVFPELKKQGILRRLRTTPLRVWQYFTSTVISQLAIGFVSLGIMFVVAITVFNLNVVGDWFSIAIWLLLGITMILGIGLAIGGWARNERQAAPLGNIIVFPMMFLSGTFFPRFLMPEWLQSVTNFLPLTPVIDGIRLLTTEGKSLLDMGTQLAMVLVWTIIIYIIAFRVFRWE